MAVTIRPVRDDDVEELVELSLLAWTPVFPSFRQILGDAIYKLIWPDRKVGQAEAVETVCKDGEKTTVYVAEIDGKAVGFIAYVLNAEAKTGEVQLLAVHPRYQNLGIGTQLNRFALDRWRRAA
jgi:ribosomal protein S18 acetylase RimI-like enzyme